MVGVMFLAFLVGIFIVTRAGRRRQQEIDTSTLVGICRSCGSTLNAADLKRLKGGIFRLRVLDGLFGSRRRTLMPHKLPCPACQSRSLVPVDTPIGRKLLDKHHS